MRTVDGMFFEVDHKTTEEPYKSLSPGWYFWGAYVEEVGPYTSLELARRGLDHYLEAL